MNNEAINEKKFVTNENKNVKKHTEKVNLSPKNNSTKIVKNNKKKSKNLNQNKNKINNTNIQTSNKQNSNKNNKQNKQQKTKIDNKNNHKKEEKLNDNNKKDTYVYLHGDNLYINLTNKCSNGCLFCVRNEKASYYGNYLWLKHGDPTSEKVINAINNIKDLSQIKEFVFCGFGEPTYKIKEMCEIADYLHSKGFVTRLNTNGQANLINKKDIVPEIKGKIDKINISLNAASAEKYQPICRSQFGSAGYTAILDFARLCKSNDIECWFSVVDCIGEDEVLACQRVADSIGIPLRVRKYIADS